MDIVFIEHTALNSATSIFFLTAGPEVWISSKMSHV